MVHMLTKTPIINDISFGPLQLDSGETIDKVTLRYEIAGPKSAPVVLVCHALTGNHHTIGTDSSPGWWSGLIGRKKYIDTERFQVITFNVLGGCDGSTGPASINPATDEPYRTSFPNITIRDMVRAQFMALQKLEISRLAAVTGGSLGGMQVLEWGLLYPAFVDKLIVLAATPTFSDYGIAFNHIAASSIKADPNWNKGNYDSNHSLKGLELARMIGMVTYRSSALFNKRFDREKKGKTYDVTSYLDYQGEKLTHRFDPNSYLYLLEAMNNHDVSFHRSEWKKAIQNIQCPVLAISYEKDLVYEPPIINELAEAIPNSTYYHIHTDFGHDGFLTEFHKWGNIVFDFLNESQS
ncbi:homoserine O-acetyltransferase [Virgibacillus byunsanensis]|uniref:Homoserine O-acetyltransferase n=1 Tax=Virgibacillus byunsanensis TaxID=570945 RepID=A0ABW3LGN3_9BACI